MYLEHCELIVKIWKGSERRAIEASKTYTERYWEKYSVIHKKCFDSYIVFKEVHRQYFIDKGVIGSKWVQLEFNI